MLTFMSYLKIPIHFSAELPDMDFSNFTYYWKMAFANLMTETFFSNEIKNLSFLHEI